MSRIILHIDRIVMRGIDEMEREQLESALRETLISSLAAPGTVEHIRLRGYVAKLDGLSLSLHTGGQDAHTQLGTHLGKSLARSLMR